MSALRKIEAKLGTATRNNHLHLLTYLQSQSIFNFFAHFRFEHGKYPVGGKSPLTAAGVGRLLA